MRRQRKNLDKLSGELSVRAGREDGGHVTWEAAWVGLIRQPRRGQREGAWLEAYAAAVQN